MRILTLAVPLIACASPALAANPETLPLTYDVFEVSIPHVDLDQCPATMQQEGIFCRATLANDEIHVFAFAEDGESPLVGFASFEADALPQLLN